MYKLIMIPSDPAHVDRSEAVVAVQARHCDATVTYAAIISNALSAIAQNPEGFAGKLAYFPEEQSARRGHRVESQSLVTNDLCC